MLNICLALLDHQIPAVFDDPPVQDRTYTKYVQHRLFMVSNKRKFRGTHLLYTEDVFDNENDDDELVIEFAWSYGSVSMRAIQHDKQCEEQLRSESTVLMIPLFTLEEMNKCNHYKSNHL